MITIRIALAAIALFAAGCTSGVRIQEPTTARPEPAAPVAQRPANGAIFQDGVSFRPLFESRRARYVGDTLTVTISENKTASQKTGNAAANSAQADWSVTSVQRLPGKSFQGGELSAASQSKLESKDEASASNLFSGSITVTVIEVLPNGNLVVSGRKEIGVAGEIDTLRFSGVVNPRDILAGNVVASAAIADARIDSSGRAHVEPERVTGFLARFFLSFLPFR